LAREDVLAMRGAELLLTLVMLCVCTCQSQPALVHVRLHVRARAIRGRPAATGRCDAEHGQPTTDTNNGSGGGGGRYRRCEGGTYDPPACLLLTMLLAVSSVSVLQLDDLSVAVDTTHATKRRMFDLQRRVDLIKHKVEGWRRQQIMREGHVPLAAAAALPNRPEMIINANGEASNL
jgi:hypothetical protein